MTLDWRLPDETTYLAFNERLILSARLHPLMALLPFIRVTGLAFLALYALAYLQLWGALIVLAVVVQWLRTRGVTAHFSFFTVFLAVLAAFFFTGITTNLATFVLTTMVLGLFVALYQLVDYLNTKLFLTDRRIFRVSGLLTRRVATMPLKALTDIRYDQTTPGRLFNYGHFFVESAGQQQALSTLRFVSQPRRFYRIVMQEALEGTLPPEHYLETLPPNPGEV